jgi:hypothetical protein
MGWITGVQFSAEAMMGSFLFDSASRTALGPTQPPIQWVPGALSMGVKWSGREADHSPPSSAEVKSVWSYVSTPSMRLHGVVLSLKNTWTNLPLPLRLIQGEIVCFKTGKISSSTPH